MKIDNAEIGLWSIVYINSMYLIRGTSWKVVDCPICGKLCEEPNTGIHNSIQTPIHDRNTPLQMYARVLRITTNNYSIP